TELCGAGHSLMRSTVRVVSPQAFQTWLRGQKANAPPPVGSAPPNVNEAVPGYSTGGGGSSSSSGASSGSSSSSAGSSTGAASATSAAAGKAVFTGDAGCGGCHTLAAAGTTGTVGPDLDQRLKADCALPASQQVRGTTLQKCIETAITKPY